MTWGMSNLVSIRLDIVLVSAQDRGTVCAERTIGFEIILDAPNGAYHRLKIVLDAPDGAPR